MAVETATTAEPGADSDLDSDNYYYSDSYFACWNDDDQKIYCYSVDDDYYYKPWQ